jgi:hypothetical protein
VTALAPTLSRSSIKPGESATLTWAVSDATTVTIDPGISVVVPAFSRVVSPQSRPPTR